MSYLQVAYYFYVYLLFDIKVTVLEVKKKNFLLSLLSALRKKNLKKRLFVLHRMLVLGVQWKLFESLHRN